MTRKQALPYVSFVVDDSGNGRSLGADQYSTTRETGHNYSSVLVGWQCGFEPLFVAVHSYLDVGLADDDCEDIATEYLEERGWFGGEPKPCDYIIR